MDMTNEERLAEHDVERLDRLDRGNWGLGDRNWILARMRELRKDLDDAGTEIQRLHASIFVQDEKIAKLEKRVEYEQDRRLREQERANNALAQVDELEKDRARLKFVANHPNTVEFDNGRVSWIVKCYDENSESDWPYVVRHVGNGDMNESVDWAMAHPKECATIPEITVESTNSNKKS